MANPERGEVRLPVNGTTYTLKLTMQSAIELQKRKGKPVGQLFQAITEMDIDAIVGVLWASLQEHHPREFKTEQQVAVLLEQAGGFANLPVFVNTIAELVALNTPAKDGETNPPQAPTGGTVESDTSSLAASV